jgi:hypothetical protein
VECQVLPFDLVVSADHFALDEGPEAMHFLSVRPAADILAVDMANGEAVILLVQVLKADPLIGAEQTDLGGDPLSQDITLLVNITDADAVTMCRKLRRGNSRAGLS